MTSEQSSKPKKKNGSGRSVAYLVKSLLLLVFLMICISPVIIGGRAYLRSYAE